MSRTALMVAGYRGRATARPDPLCHDPWAAELAGELGLELSVKHDEAFAQGELWLGLRTAFIDRLVTERIGPDRPQVVILGAGMDTRSARLAREGVRFFEVDHPDTQAEKRRRVAELDGYPVDACTWVRCNFEQDDFVEQLTAAGFDPAQAAVVVWEGVTPYLTDGAIRATLERLATLHPDSIVVFDYIQKKLAQGGSVDEGGEALRELVDSLGEPFRFGVNDPPPLLADAGFTKVRTLNFDEVALDFGRGYDRSRQFRFQGFVVASRRARLGP